MILFYHWPEHYLLVTFTIRGGNQYGLLVEHASQEEVMEHIKEHFTAEGNREMVQFSVEALSEDAYDVLLPLYERIGAGTRVIRGE